MKLLLSLFVIGIIVCAWCPWFTEQEARDLIYGKVYESQSTLQKGCTLTIDDRSFKKVLFGYQQKVGYACTFNTDFITDGTNTVMVTFFKEVLNVPHPIVK